jgi:hypothetical protein
VTIAKEVELKDPAENLGAQIMREASERTGAAVGDGTTTATLLAHALLMEGIRNIADGAIAALAPSKAAATKFESRSRRLRRIMTARSCGSGWPSLSVAWPCCVSALLPRRR